MMSWFPTEPDVQFRDKSGATIVNRVGRVYGASKPGIRLP